MALTPPTYMELGTFRNEPFPSEDSAYVTQVLQEATDSVWANTGLEDYPADARAARITRYAIMDLSLWLLSQQEHQEEINAPFSSERIGSYSYSKMQQARRGEETGIYWLDMLFSMLRSWDEDSALGLVTSERVFNPGGLTYWEQVAMDKATSPYHDPSSYIFLEE